MSNDPEWSATNLPRPLGDFTTGLASQFSNPNPSGEASGGLVNAAVVTQVEGSAVPQPKGQLFLDSLLVRLGIKSYKDSAVTNFASATGIEVDLAIDGDANAVQNVFGYYVVPILGQVNEGGVSGHIRSIAMIRTDSIQGAANKDGLRIDTLTGIHAGRPAKNPKNVAVGVQYSLISEPGTLIYTDSSEDRAWLGVKDALNSEHVIWLRINPAGHLEFCNASGAVIATLGTAGELKVSVLTAEQVSATDEKWREASSPPVSGRTYQNTSGVALEISANYLTGDGPGKIDVDLSADGKAWRTWVSHSYTEANVTAQVQFRCPANWHYRITINGAGASLGSLNALG